MIIPHANHAYRNITYNKIFGRKMLLSLYLLFCNLTLMVVFKLTLCRQGHIHDLTMIDSLYIPCRVLETFP